MREIKEILDNLLKTSTIEELKDLQLKIKKEDPYFKQKWDMVEQAMATKGYKP